MNPCTMLLLALATMLGCLHAPSVALAKLDNRFLRNTGLLRKAAPSGPPIRQSYEPMPELAFDASAEPTADDWDAMGTLEPSASPESEREYPCRDGYTLQKQYKVYPKFKYYCIKPDRPPALTERAECANGFYLQNTQCIKSSDNCDFFPRLPSCFKPPCAKGAPIVIQKILTCVICPKDYQTYFDRGAYKCYKLLQEKPRCPPGEKFKKDAGACEAK